MFLSRRGVLQTNLGGLKLSGQVESTENHFSGNPNREVRKKSECNSSNDAGYNDFSGRLICDGKD
jgi:hypothetical protein